MEVIATTNAPKALGPYSQAVLAGSILFVSGQIAINPETGEFFVTDAKDYVTPGTLYCFSRDGKKKWSMAAKQIRMPAMPRLDFHISHLPLRSRGRG